MVKLIFLDVDGVLNFDCCKAHCGAYMGIDDDKVKMLAEIVRATNAKIVLSSTWRDEWFRIEKEEQNTTANYLDKKLRAGGLRIFDKTPDLCWHERGKEIAEYLQRFPAKEWLIIDDEVFSDFNRPEIAGHLHERKEKILDCSHERLLEREAVSLDEEER